MSGFLFRWLVAFVVLAAIYNPLEKYNYIAWAQENYETRQALVIGIGVILALVVLIMLVGTIRTMGWVGIILVAIILGLLSYILKGEGFMTYEFNSTNIWGGLVILSLVVAGALSWRSGRKASVRAARQESKTAKAA